MVGDTSMVGRRLVLGVVCLGLVACYTYQPLRGANPEIGTRVAFDVNDAGRVALGGQIGPEIGQIEGHLLDRDEVEGYLLSVTGVHLLRGGEQVWSGEEVRLKPEYVSGVLERRFSAGRSIAAGVIFIGGFTTLIITRDIFGFGTSEEEPAPPETLDARIGRP